MHVVRQIFWRYLESRGEVERGRVLKHVIHLISKAGNQNSRYCGADRAVKGGHLLLPLQQQLQSFKERRRSPLAVGIDTELDEGTTFDHPKVNWQTRLPWPIDFGGISS